MAGGTNTSSKKHFDEDLYARLGVVETDVSHLGRAFEQLTLRVDDGFSRQAKALQQLSEELTSRSQVSWTLVAMVVFGVVAAMGTTGAGLLTIGSLSLSPLRQRQDLLSKQLASFREDFRDHELSDGHPAMSERVKALETETIDLDKDLQVEMRALDAAMGARLDALDEALQREMRMADDTLKSNVDSVTARFERLQNEFDRHASEADHPYGVLNKVEYLRGLEDGRRQAEEEMR